MRLLVDPLYAETVPDGTFGGARPPRSTRSGRWTALQVAAHRELLEAELRRHRPPRTPARPERTPV